MKNDWVLNLLIFLIVVAVFFIPVYLLITEGFPK